MERPDSQTEGKERRVQTDRERLHDALLQQQNRDKDVQEERRRDALLQQLQLQRAALLQQKREKELQDAHFRTLRTGEGILGSDPLQPQEMKKMLSKVSSDTLGSKNVPSASALWSHRITLKSQLESMYAHLAETEHDVKEILGTYSLFAAEKGTYVADFRQRVDDLLAKQQQKYREAIVQWSDDVLAKEKQTHEEALRQKEVKCRILKPPDAAPAFTSTSNRPRWRCSEQRSRNSATRGISGGICTTNTSRTMTGRRTPDDRARGGASRVKRRWRQRS